MSVSIYCVNTKTTQKVPVGSTLGEIYDAFEIKLPYRVISARVNNKSEGLNYRVYRNKDVEFFDVTHPSAMRAYLRSLCFVLSKAVHDLYPKGEVVIEHPVSNGYYCNLYLDDTLTFEQVLSIKVRMQEIINADIPFKYFEARSEDAVKLFEKHGMNDKVKLLQTTGALYTVYHQLDDMVDAFYGCLVPSTGYLTTYDFVKYYDGALLRIPRKDNPNEVSDVVKQKKMLDVFDEALNWNSILKLHNVGDLNIATATGKSSQLINVAEVLQEKKIGQIADAIALKNIEADGVRIILISGPSSSGKTTFSRRLSTQLICNGLNPIPLSLDNYFLDREHTPLDEKGEYDFETLDALDLNLLNEQLKAVLSGEEVKTPEYNFKTGKKEYDDKRTLKIDENSILVLEGIHALNPSLIPGLSSTETFKIYVSALTTISVDNHNWVSTTDNRLLRRIIRDYKYRGYSAKDTISRWPSVRAGEDKWIFPNQENADVMFNSALIFELAAIRDHVEPVLRQVPRNCPEYAEAFRLLRFIGLFNSISDEEIPASSLLREFLGGSLFRV
ncbi:MAG: nucleoside kinase [Bacteroidaceae bacterium]